MSKDKRDEHAAASQELARTRLLKANNVQRRRFEKMADAAIQRAESAVREVNQETRVLCQQSVVRKYMGDDYDRLVGIREVILGHKRAIEELRTVAKTIESRLRSVGIHTGYRGMDYFTNPAIPDPEDESCSTVVGDKHLQGLSLVECRTKDPWIEYERLVLTAGLEEDTVQQDGEDLRAAVWQLTTTDEIVDAINTFKEKYDV